MIKNKLPEEQISHLSWHLLIKDIWKWVRPYRVRFFIASGMRFSGDLVLLYPPLALAWMITFLSQYKAGQSLTELWFTFILFCAAHFWRMATNHIGRVMCYFIGERITLDVERFAIHHLLKLSAHWHEKENTGNKYRKITRGSNAYNKLLTIWIHSVIKIAVYIIAIPWILLHIDPLMTALMVGFSITYFFIAQRLTKPAVQAAHETNIKDEEYTGLSFQVLHNIRSIQVYGSNRLFLERIGVMITIVYQAICKRLWKFTIRNASLEIWQLFFRVSMIFIIILGVLNGHYEIGFLVAFVWYFNALAESVRELADISQEFVVARLSIQRLNAIMQEQPNDLHDSQTHILHQDWKRITFRNVSFSYGENTVLHKISFDVKRGERVGIVGLSGAGKSTLFKLLMKEYQNYTGGILFDKIELKNISRNTYFEKIAVVLQETEVFNFSLKDNIILSRSDSNFDEKALQESIETAHISDFLHKLPQGIETLVGEKGIKLSGGEKQRLGIARAIYKQPDLLLLDEATSHLDLESEEKIKDSLHHFFKKVTAVVIAHRLTTIKEMDRIIVLENGTISEEGTFAQLYRKKGRFYELWEKQKL